jgi:hypothetical protein
VTGMLVPPSDPEALRVVLERLLGDDDRRRELRAASRAVANELLVRHPAALVEAYGVAGAAGSETSG